ncbi:MAG: DUF2800 domain-containing protein [Mogibacterium sp.]|nr:DUF2800 domain-containing protein [Mogibacterium sp.]
MSGKHAKLSPSSSAKWINCPPSLQLEALYPDKTSEYAAEGTLAHKAAELAVKSHYTLLSQRSYSARLSAIKRDKAYQDEMLEYADVMLDTVKAIDRQYNSASIVATEQSVSYDAYAEGGCGTADCILINGSDLWVVDYKYGKGVPVDAHENSQLMLYGLGALELYGQIFDIKDVHMVIVQPRLNNTSQYDRTKEQLVAWGETVVKPAAELALKGEGALKVGPHCRFCKAKARCRAQAETNLELAKMEFKKAELLSDQEIGEVISKAEDLVSWANAVKDYALRALLDGKDIPGWKAVEGRSVRVFADTDAAFKKVIAAGYDEALLYERKPITLTAVEKLMGKKQFTEVLSEDVVKPQGKPTLAPESDKRAPYGLSQAQKDFN